jgi:ABC-type Zn2+ transport system substrate-binding protein/surface adhesin
MEKQEDEEDDDDNEGLAQCLRCEAGSRNGEGAAGSSDGVICIRMEKQEHEHEHEHEHEDDEDDDDDEGLVQCLRCERRLQERRGSSRKQRWRDLSHNGKAGTRRRRR